MTRPVETGRLRQLRRAKDLMDRHWSHPLDLAAVAARAGDSRCHFVRRFREAYGETPGHYSAGAGAGGFRRD